MTQYVQFKVAAQYGGDLIPDSQCPVVTLAEWLECATDDDCRAEVEGYVARLLAGEKDVPVGGGAAPMIYANLVEA